MIKKILFCAFIIMFCSAKCIFSNNLELEIGQSVLFGQYYLTDDNKKEEIEWIVLDVSENKALLFSKYVIDVMQFSTTDQLSYASSTIRHFLNNEFLENFSEEEKEKIVLTKNPGYYNEEYEVEDNTYTDDYIFLLNSDEIYKYFYNEYKYLINLNVIGIGTEFAKSKGLQCIPYNKTKNINSPYWLRSIGMNSKYAQVVSYNGLVLEDGYYYLRFNCGLRPAMWINID